MSPKTRHKNYKCVQLKGGMFFVMGRKEKLDYKTRLTIVSKRIKEGVTIPRLAAMYGINETTIYKYVQLYLAFGKDGLKPKGKRNTTYTVEFKRKVVKEYLSGKSKFELAIKYKVAHSVVFNWIKQYNNNQLKDYIPQGEIYTMPSKKYSKQEKEHIILECIESKKDYKTIAKKYSISYGKLYQWVNSYEKQEKIKPVKLAQSNEERLEILLKLKEIENQALRNELEILKKNDEIYEAIQRKKLKRNA